MLPSCCFSPQPPAVNLCCFGLISVSNRSHSLPSRSLSLSFSFSVELFLSPPFPSAHSGQSHFLFISILLSPSPCLCLSLAMSPSLSRHSDSYRNGYSLPVCLPVKVEPYFNLLCLHCHFFLSVFGKWIRQQEAGSRTHLYTHVHAFDSLLEMPTFDRVCG